jgi:hypothetical protein
MIRRQHPNKTPLNISTLSPIIIQESGENGFSNILEILLYKTYLENRISIGLGKPDLSCQMVMVIEKSVEVEQLNSYTQLFYALNSMFLLQNSGVYERILV